MAAELPELPGNRAADQDLLVVDRDVPQHTGQAVREPLGERALEARGEHRPQVGAVEVVVRRDVLLIGTGVRAQQQVEAVGALGPAGDPVDAALLVEAGRPAPHRALVLQRDHDRGLDARGQHPRPELPVGGACLLELDAGLARRRLARVRNHGEIRGPDLEPRLGGGRAARQPGQDRKAHQPVAHPRPPAERILVLRRRLAAAAPVGSHGGPWRPWWDSNPRSPP